MYPNGKEKMSSPSPLPITIKTVLEAGSPQPSFQDRTNLGASSFLIGCLFVLFLKKTLSLLIHTSNKDFA